jgi:hypothetical protein
VTLADLRRFAVRKQTQIRFPIRTGQECVMTVQGIAQVPGLKAAPDFNLEEELASADDFTLEPTGAAPRRIAREELARMASAGAASGPVTDHEDD